MTKLLLGAASIALALTASPVQAQLLDYDFRLGAQTTEPTGDISDAFDYGYGLYFRAGTRAAATDRVWSLMAAATWTRFKPSSNAVDDLDEFTVQFGPHIGLRQGFDLGVEAAYFTEAEEFGLVPVLSVGLVNIEATLSYSTTFNSPQASWLALGIGLKF